MNLDAGSAIYADTLAYDEPSYVVHAPWPSSSESMTSARATNVVSYGIGKMRNKKSFLSQNLFNERVEMVVIHDESLRMWDDVLREIESADSGVAASSVVKSLEDFYIQIPRDFCFPEVERDEDDGAVALRWYSRQNGRTFSINFVGNNEVVATVMPPVEQQTALWRFKVSDERKISDFLSEQSVREIAVSAS